MLQLKFRTKKLLFTAAATGLAQIMGSAQVPATAPETNAGATSAAAVAFEVVSIRPSDPQSTRHDLKITADGYHVLGLPLLPQIANAYSPQTGTPAAFATDRVKEYPAWAATENYDIEAKISEADQAEWQRPQTRPAMLRAMLRQMFAERCHMKAHREVRQGAVYSLVVGKSGPKLKPSDPNEVHPPGTSLPGGGILVTDDAKGTTTVYGATIQSFLGLVASVGGGERPIEDNTGLTGRYDFVDKHEESRGGEQKDTTSASDPQPTLSSFMKTWGLELIPATGPVETLVIDHIERPSAN